MRVDWRACAREKVTRESGEAKKTSYLCSQDRMDSTSNAHSIETQTGAGPGTRPSGVARSSREPRAQQDTPHSHRNHTPHTAAVQRGRRATRRGHAPN